MKKVAIGFTATLLSLGLAAGALGQTRPPGSAAPKSDTGSTTNKTTDDAQRQVWTPDAGSVETGKLVGTKVKTSDGDSVGSIDQLIFNQTDGKITHAIIAKGGVLGVGATKLVFKWSDVKIQHDPDNPDQVVALIERAKLDAAPKYEARKDRDLTPSASPSPNGPKRTGEPVKKY